VQVPVVLQQEILAAVLLFYRAHTLLEAEELETAQMAVLGELALHTMGVLGVQVEM
jgi:hypothetical protein